MEASSVKEKSTAYQEGVEYLNILEPDIRKEAWELKDCCTRYAFQGITLLTTAYAIIGRLIFTSINVGFVGAILAVLCLVLISLITYKYGSSNRVYGYLLHIQRSNPSKSNLTDEFSLSPPKSEYGWGPWMRFIGWEEALRAWRVVQPTVYFAEKLLGGTKEYSNHASVATATYTLQEIRKIQMVYSQCSCGKSSGV